jgi:hypothetical protein
VSIREWYSLEKIQDKLDFQSPFNFQVLSCAFIHRNSTVGWEGGEVSLQEAVLIRSSNSLVIDLIEILHIILVIEIQICYKIIEMHIQCSVRVAFQLWEN